MCCIGCDWGEFDLVDIVLWFILLVVEFGEYGFCVRLVVFDFEWICVVFMVGCIVFGIGVDICWCFGIIGF